MSLEGLDASVVGQVSIEITIRAAFSRPVLLLLARTLTALILSLTSRKINKFKLLTLGAMIAR